MITKAHHTAARPRSGVLSPRFTTSPRLAQPSSAPCASKAAVNLHSSNYSRGARGLSRLLSPWHSPKVALPNLATSCFALVASIRILHGLLYKIKPAYGLRSRSFIAIQFYAVHDWRRSILIASAMSKLQHIHSQFLLLCLDFSASKTPKASV